MAFHFNDFYQMNIIHPSFSYFLFCCDFAVMSYCPSSVIKPNKEGKCSHLLLVVICAASCKQNQARNELLVTALSLFKALGPPSSA